MREQSFGPVAPMVPVKSLDEAIDLTNGTRIESRIASKEWWYPSGGGGRPQGAGA